MIWLLCKSWQLTDIIADNGHQGTSTNSTKYSYWGTSNVDLRVEILQFTDCICWTFLQYNWTIVCLKLSMVDIQTRLTTSNTEYLCLPLFWKEIIRKIFPQQNRYLHFSTSKFRIFKDQQITFFLKYSYRKPLNCSRNKLYKLILSPQKWSWR